LAIIGSRQYEDWQHLRHLDASLSEVALRIEKFCANICRALEQEWLSPEERREAEARRVAEADEHRRQEAEIKQHADEAEAEALRLAKKDHRRKETEAKRGAEDVERPRAPEATIDLGAPTPAFNNGGEGSKSEA
jgi:hypothetical protein